MWLTLTTTTFSIFIKSYLFVLLQSFTGKSELYSYSHYQTKPVDYFYTFDKYSYQFNHSAFNQYVGYSYNIFEPFSHNFEVADSEEVAAESVVEAFTFMRQSTIKSFFNSQLVDIPICFRKSKSLYNLTFEIPTIKTMNILMRSGLRGRVLKALTFSFHNIFSKINSDLTPTLYLHWTLLHQVLNSLFIDGRFVMKTATFDDDLNVPLYAGNRFELDNYHRNYKSTIQHLLFDNLQTYVPIFSFYIRKVDKSIRKNSRGKSGKYTIIWKYVPTYKRLYVVIRWLLRDLKFQKVKEFENRLIKILEVFLFTPQSSFLVRLRKFVHNFVFQNFKQTLLKHLRSTS